MSDAAAQPGGARRALAWLAPGLLCAIAVLQLVVTSHGDLSPWKLGGFGMYSGVDSVRARWIRLVVVTPAGELPVPFERLIEDRPWLAHEARNLRSLPRAGALAAIGRALLAGPAVFADCTPGRLRGPAGRVSGHFVRLLGPGQLRGLGCRPLPVAGLRLEIWRYRYASRERRLRGDELLEVQVAAAPRGREAGRSGGAP